MYITQYTHALFNITLNLAEDVICNKHIKLKFYWYDLSSIYSFIRSTIKVLEHEKNNCFYALKFSFYWCKRWLIE